MMFFLTKDKGYATKIETVKKTRPVIAIISPPSQTLAPTAKRLKSADPDCEDFGPQLPLILIV
jgi:hypothetical protein